MSLYRRNCVSEIVKAFLVDKYNEVPDRLRIRDVEFSLADVTDINRHMETMRAVTHEIRTLGFSCLSQSLLLTYFFFSYSCNQCEVIVLLDAGEDGDQGCFMLTADKPVNMAEVR